MTYRVIIFLAQAFALLTFMEACNFTSDTSKVEQEDTSMPKTAKVAKAHLTDVNCWSEGDMFYAAGIIDSDDFFWKRFWVELEIIDTNQQTVLVLADSFTIVPAHSWATPPRGRTTFFGSWKLADLKGTPDSVRLKSAQGVELNAGAILLVSDQKGVRVLENLASVESPEKMKLDSTNEIAWTISGTLENPLPQYAERPCIDVLLYGKDNRLYFTQAIDLNVDTTIIKSAAWGPMLPNEKRGFGMNIGYDALPAPLKKLKIGKVDILGFEKR